MLYNNIMYRRTNTNNYGEIGPTGPAGPTGTTGATGATGPTGTDFALEGFSSYFTSTTIPANPARTRFRLTNTTIQWTRTSNYNQTTGIYTIPTTGVYQFSFRGRHSNDTATTESVAFAIDPPGMISGDWILIREGLSAGKVAVCSGDVTRQCTVGDLYSFNWIPNSVGIQTIIYTSEIAYMGP